MAKSTDAAARWLASMTNPQTAQNYKDGINATSKNPMALAAQNINGYLQGVQEAVSSGRMVAALNNTPVSLWKNNSINVGSTRLAAGAKRGKQGAGVLSEVDPDLRQYQYDDPEHAQGRARERDGQATGDLHDVEASCREKHQLSEGCDIMPAITPQFSLALCLLTIMLVVGIWDIYAYAVSRPDATVSAIIGQWGHEFPMLSVAIGVLIGHLFWPRESIRKD